jgi:hypothetical protein
MFKTASRNRQRWSAFGTDGLTVTGSVRPPKREQLQQDRSPLSVEAFDSPGEYLEARERAARTGAAFYIRSTNETENCRC